MRSRKRKLVDQINVTPFVDVALVLLLIFMVITPIMESSVNVNLPKQEAGSAFIGRNESVNIVVTKNKEIFLNDKKVDTKNLINEIKNTIGEKDNKALKIYVRGDEEVEYGCMVSIMDIMIQSGYKNLCLVTQVKKK